MMTMMGEIIMNHALPTTMRRKMEAPLLLTLTLLLGGCVTIQNNPTPQHGVAQNGAPYHAGYATCTACGHAIGSAEGVATIGGSSYRNYGYYQGGMTAAGERIIYVPVPVPQAQQVTQDQPTTTDRVIDLIGAGIDLMGRNGGTRRADPVIVDVQSKNNGEKQENEERTSDDVIVVRTGDGVKRVDCPDTTEDRVTEPTHHIYAGNTESAFDNGRMTDQVSATPTITPATTKKERITSPSTTSTTRAIDNRRVTDQVSATPTITPVTTQKKRVPSPTTTSTTRATDNGRATVQVSPAPVKKRVEPTVDQSSRDSVDGASRTVIPSSSSPTSSSTTTPVPASPINVPVSPAAPAVVPAPASTATSGKVVTSG